MHINLPTWLTLFRVLLLPVMVLVFYWQFPGHNITAAVVFLLAAITDWLDGYLARRMNLTSAFGAFLDPVADQPPRCDSTSRNSVTATISLSATGSRKAPKAEVRFMRRAR